MSRRHTLCKRCGLRQWLCLFVVVVSSDIRAAEPPITALAMAPDGKSVVVGSQAGLEIRSWPGLDHGERISGELDHIHDLVFSPDGTLLAAAGGSPGELGGVALYSWPARTLLGHIHPHRDLIYALAWNRDATQIATASGDQRVGVLRVEKAKSPPLVLDRMLEGHSRGVLGLCYLPGDALLVSAGIDETIRVWNLANGQTQRTLSNHTRPVVALAVRSGAADEGPPLLASAGEDRTVRFWQPTIGRLVRFTRLESAPQAIAWSRDGKSLWAACHDGRVRQVDSETAAASHDLPALAGVAYSLAIAADGSLIVGGENGELVRVTVP